MAFKLVLYENSSDKRALNKSIVEKATVTFTEKDNIDYLNPTIKLGAENIIGALKTHKALSRINYCYIPGYNRYYYVTVTAEQSGVYTLNCSVDVMMSYKSYISNMTCFIARQESIYNKYIIDEKYPMRATRYLEYKDIGALPSGTGCNIAVTVTGGN